MKFADVEILSAGFEISHIQVWKTAAGLPTAAKASPVH
jgi:hypothetical protein